MPRPPRPDPHQRLQPAGRRWGFGAHTVVPYLTHTTQATAGDTAAEGIRNPVFPQMEKALRAVQRRH